MKAKQRSIMILMIAILTGCVYFLLDGFVFYLFSNEINMTFVHHVMNISSHEFWMRLVTFVIFLCFGALIAHFFNKEKQENLRFKKVQRELKDQLDISVADAKHMKEMEVKLRNILDSICDCVCVVERDGTISYANPAVYKELDLINENRVLKMNDILSADECKIAVERMHLAINQGKALPTKVFNFHVPGDDERIRPAEVNTTPFMEEGTQKILVVARPITERLQLEEEQLRSERLNAIGILAGGIAHDFNNLLVGILANGSLLMELIKSDDDTKKVLIEEMVSAAKRAAKLTSQLLTFAKGGEPKKEETPMQKLITDIAKFSLKGSNVVAQFSFSDDLLHGCVDAGQISQVIQNLVINASQAMPDGGVIHIGAENVTFSDENLMRLSEGRYVHIWVKDTGIGIPEKYINKIFDPYFSTKSVSGNGSGLGLAVSRSIIKKHGGHISVESIFGVGTTFHIHLPGAVPKISEEKNVVQKVNGRKGLNILIMDDDPQIRCILSKFCAHLGHHEVLVQDGVEALEKYREAYELGHSFDLVMLDLTIPNGMGGVETLKRLKEINPLVISVVSSGYSEDKPDGFDHFLPKPFELSAMRALFAQIA